MTRKISFLLVFAAVAACSDDSPTINALPRTPSDPNQSKFSEISVSLDVSGDPSSGLAEYTVFVDGIASAKIKPREEVKILLAYGFHTVALEHASLFPNVWWCTYRGAKTFSVVNDEGHSPRVTFGLDCPPLEGTGKTSLVFYEPGISDKSDLGVTLTRLNGSSFALYFIAKPEVENSVEAPPGIYRVSASNARCNMSYLNLELDLARAVVRADKSSNYSYSLECH